MQNSCYAWALHGGQPGVKDVEVSPETKGVGRGEYVVRWTPTNEISDIELNTDKATTPLPSMEHFY